MSESRVHDFIQHPLQPNNRLCQWQFGFTWGPRCEQWSNAPIHDADDPGDEKGT